ncbi:unnamed protein product [Pylaiella littoralis]
MRRFCRRWLGEWLLLLLLPFANNLTSIIRVLGQEEDVWWKPGPGVNWDWMLQGTPKISAGVEVFDIDLFDVGAADIQTLKDAGITVICYFSAGTYESYREDEGSFPKSALGLKSNSEDEWWININDEDILPVMTNRLDMAVEKGCDAVDPDAIETFTYPEEVTGWAITADEQLVYNKWIADQAHLRNLSVGLKNDRNQVEELEPWFDWALSTDCFTEQNCSAYTPFTAAGKAVLDAEFEVADLSLCDDTLWYPIDFIVKNTDLDEVRCSCGFPETNFECEALLAGFSPTGAPSDTDSSSGRGTVDGRDDGDTGTPTWAIVTAIAVVVLMAMVTYGALLFRKRAVRKKTEGVDDFFS